jgi:hypothetical protein
MSQEDEDTRTPRRVYDNRQQYPNATPMSSVSSQRSNQGIYIYI